MESIRFGENSGEFRRRNVMQCRKRRFKSIVCIQQPFREAPLFVRNDSMPWAQCKVVQKNLTDLQKKRDLNHRQIELQHIRDMAQWSALHAHIHEQLAHRDPGYVPIPHPVSYPVCLHYPEYINQNPLKTNELEPSSTFVPELIDAFLHFFLDYSSVKSIFQKNFK